MAGFPGIGNLAGGAIYLDGTNSTPEAVTLSGNSVTVSAADRSGGDGIPDDGNSTSLTGSTFQGDAANVGAPPAPGAGACEADGGGALLFVTVRDGISMAALTISVDSAPSAAGGGVLVYPNPGPSNAISEARIAGSIVAGDTRASPSDGNCATSSDALPSTTVITSLGHDLADGPGNSCGFTALGDLIAPCGATGGPTGARGDDVHPHGRKCRRLPQHGCAAARPVALGGHRLVVDQVATEGVTGAPPACATTIRLRPASLAS